ncbi:MAG: hypothetical protein RIS76_4610 [Verrucomicrobiota bacterium]|jgi:uncharacterized protein (TIGR02172 family)
MQITSKNDGNALILSLSGALDITTAETLEQALKLEGIEHLTVDLEMCHFISSVGLRVLMRAHKQLAAGHHPMVLANVSREVYSILDLTGLARMIPIKQKIREIPLKGLPLISAGVCGECYRLDRERIIKLYNEGVGPETAEREKAYSKAAFIMGIPTAISYELVACGNRTGIVYEMLEAELFSAIIRNDLDNMDHHGQTLATIAKSIHATPGDPAVFPNMKERFRGYIPQMNFFLSSKEIAFLLDKLEAIPDADSCIHFDIHSSNIMIRNGEALVIDMGDLSIGSHLFDVALLFTIYGVPELGISELATKIPNEHGVLLWNAFVKNYFAGQPPEAYQVFHRDRYFYASLRLIYTITFLPKLRDECVRWIKDVLLPKMLAE